MLKLSFEKCQVAEVRVFSAEERVRVKLQRWEIAYCHGGLKSSGEMGILGHCGNLNFSLNRKQIRTFYNGFLKFKSIFKGFFLLFIKIALAAGAKAGGRGRLVGSVCD